VILLAETCHLFATGPKYADLPGVFESAAVISNASMSASSPVTPRAAAAPKYSDLPGLVQPETVISNASMPASSQVPARAHSESGRDSDPLKAGLPTSTNSMDGLDDVHRLALGDRVSFRIEEDLEEPKSLVVMDSGDLQVPYIGRFPAENKTCRELAREIKAALEKEYYYQATVIIAVELMAKSRGKVYIVGPVRLPGPQEIPSDEVLTLSKAILRAGGFNDFADKHNVKVTRKVGADGSGKQMFVVDVAKIFEKGKVELDLILKPGDLIIVPERLIRF